ncbi:MAG: hypothetical protein JWN93_264 [Hyphomicrobiales bacterium]|nr:hypothetical protein [Hyphomicrobiales bacterium]
MEEELHPVVEAYYHALRSRDPARILRARKLLESDATLNDEDRIHFSAMFAHEDGHDDEALQILSEAIAQGFDNRSGFLMFRSSIYISMKRYAEALADIECVLAEKEPHMVERFHPSYKFRKAYALAMLADPAFPATFAQIDPDYSERLDRGRKTKADLARIYEERVAGKDRR